MAKDLPAQVIAQLDADHRRPVLLYTLGLASDVRFAASNVNITFPTAGDVYTAKAIVLSGVKQSLGGFIDRVTVKFDNAGQDMAAYISSQDVAGKSLVIKKVFLDEVGDASYYDEIFRGVMERPQAGAVTLKWCTISAVAGKTLKQKPYLRKYSRGCPWEFGGKKCNYAGNADLTSLTASGTADGGTTTTLVDNALTQADDYWNYGVIKITKAGITYQRVVLDFVAGTDTVSWRVELPFAVDSDCTYVMYKGCSKAWETCGAENAWGPSADNQLAYGGFIHIGRATQITIPTG